MLLESTKYSHLKINISQILTYILVIGFLLGGSRILEAAPLYGPTPSNAAGGQMVPGDNFTPPIVPNQAVPSANGPGFNIPNSNNASNNGSSSPTTNGGPSQGAINPNSGSGTPEQAGGSQTPASTAPTFMNSTLPNTTNPFLPNNISPGLISGPIENAYLLNGVPQLAAPLMSTVYRPFGLTYFQPNPFQVTPQGSFSLTGSYGEETNINFSPTQPESGGYYMIMPAVMYSNFNDYGYISLLASASYFGYDTGNISPYFDEMGGVTLGTYLGPRVFIGAQDFVFNGSSPLMNGSPLQFFNGINSSYGNMADAEIGVALSPKVSFIQAASDQYFASENYGAGIMNLQAIIDSLNYMDKTNFLSASYIYQIGIMTDFPNFYSNGTTGTAMHQISPTTSLGVGGTLFYFSYQGLPDLNTKSYSIYGIFSHKLTRTVSFSGMGGWNVISFQNGETFQAPEWDVNLGYSGPRLSLGINAGEFIEEGTSFGIEMGPENVEEITGYLSYLISPKTMFFSSVGYSYYDFLSAYNFSNNFFKTLQPNVSYNGAFLEQTDGISYTPYTWLSTSLVYNFIEGTSNIPNETVVDNIFMAMITFTWNFR
jgi:hypothetical protein